MADMNISFRITALDNFSRTMRDFSGKLEKVQPSLRSVGTSAVAAGSLLAAGLGYAVKKSADFGSQMSKVGALAGASGKQMGELKSAAMDMGAKSVFSASQVADGMSELGAAGFNTSQIIKAMPGVLNAAAASGSSMAETSEIVVSALNAFQMKASDSNHIADVMSATANKTAAGMADLGYSFKYAAAPAHSLGFSLESVAAATGIMANAGIKGETAGTTLREAMLRLANPTKSVTAELKTLGVNIKDSHGNMLPLDKIIGQLNTKTQGMSKTQKTAALATIFGTNAVSGMLAVVDAGPSKFDKLQSSLEHSDGSAKKAANSMQNNLKGALNQLSGAFESAAISIGDALTPALEMIAGIIQKVVQGFLNLPKGMQSFIAIGAAVAAVATILGGGLLIFASILPGIIAGFATLAGVFTTVILPIAGIVAGVAALVTGFVLAYNKVAWFHNGVNAILTALKTVTMSVFSTTASFINQKITQIKVFWTQNGAMITQATRNIFNGIKVAITAILNVIGPFIHTWLLGVKTVFSTVWSTIKGVINNALKIILGIVRAFGALFTGNWKALWSSIKQILSGVWGIIRSIIKGALSVIKTIISTDWKLIKSLSSSAWGGIKTVISSVWSSIKSLVSSAASSVVSHIKSAWSSAKSNTVSLFGNIKDAAIGKMKDIVTWAAGLPGRIGSGILKKASDAVNGIKKLAKKLIDEFKSMLGIHSPSKVFQNLGGYVIKGLVNGLSAGNMKDLAVSVMKDFGGGLVGSWNDIKSLFGGGAMSDIQGFFSGAGKGLGKISGNVKGWLSKALAATGTSASWLPGLAKLVGAESGGNPLAVNKTAVGKQHATGLLQMLPTTFAANAVSGLGGITNPIANAAAAINYIKSRYGSVFNTPLFKGGAYKGYAGGTDGSPAGLAWVAEKGRELLQMPGIGTFLASTKQLINLPRGTAVAPHSETEKILSGAKIPGFAKGTGKITTSGVTNKIKNKEVAFETKQISASSYVKALEAIRKAYKLTGDQARRVTKGIYNAHQSAIKVTASEKKAQDALNRSVKSAADSYEKKIESINSTLASKIKSAQDTYKSALSEKTNSIYTATGLFDAPGSTPAYKQDAMFDLKSQVKQMQQFQKDLNTLSKDKAPSAFVTELRNMGTGSAVQIHALTTMSKKELSQYISLWKQKHSLSASEAKIEAAPDKKTEDAAIKAAKADANKSLAQAKTDFINKIKSYKSDVAKGARTLGTSAVSGMIKGLRDMGGPLASAAKKIANTVTSTIKKTLKIHSPSLVLRNEVGQYIGKGMALGMMDSVRSVSNAANALAQTSIPTVNRLPYNGHVNTSSATTAGASSTSGQRQVVIENVMVMDGREVGRIVTPYVGINMQDRVQLKTVFTGDR